MKKVLLIIGILAITLIALPVVAAVTCPDGSHYDSAASKCVVNPSSPGYNIATRDGYYCKNVVYSEWGECIHLFNVQIRTILERPGNCNVTTRQQVEQIKFCDGLGWFADSIK